jgi:hypothetical protein
MSAHPLVRNLFGQFQNLNLLILREDLRRGWAARGAWSSGGNLCPLAHGLGGGAIVLALQRLSKAVDLEQASLDVARRLGVLPIDVYRFVRFWDDPQRFVSPNWLLGQLDALWAERLADGDCVQSILAVGVAVPLAEPELRGAR